MRFAPVCILPLLLAVLTAASPGTEPPVGVYRTGAHYHRRQPSPGGQDVRRSDKRNSMVVIQQRGPARLKTMVPLDSVWGYVNARGRSYRLFQGNEFQIEQADTITIYSSIDGQQYVGPQGRPRAYYFSRGLTGLIFPLTEKNLRLAYEASNPAFVQSIKALGFAKDLTNYDVEAGTFRVVKLFRQAIGK